MIRQKQTPLFMRGIFIVCFVGMPQTASAQAATDVSAQNAAIAQKLYDDAMQLMEEKKYAEACPKLAESDRLDTGMGTRFNLGDCYENLGRLASAWALFTDVADEAKRTKQTGRESVARQRAMQLDARLPKMTLQVPLSVANVSGVEVRDGDNVVKQPLWGQPLPVDPGKHTIVVRAPGRQTWQKIVVLKEGVAETVVIGDLASMGLAKQTGAIVLGSAGVAGIVVGTVFGLRARSKWRNDVVLKSCNGGVVTLCDLGDAQARLEKSGARTDATISTVSFVAGGVAFAGALVVALWSREKHAEGATKTVQVQLVPMGSGGGGIVCDGRVLMKKASVCMGSDGVENPALRALPPPNPLYLQLRIAPQCCVESPHEAFASPTRNESENVGARFIAPSFFVTFPEGAIHRAPTFGLNVDWNELS